MTEERRREIDKIIWLLERGEESILKELAEIILSAREKVNKEDV